MGENITLVGGNGDGQTTKVANQIIVALNIAAVGEALVFASKAGAAQLMQACAAIGVQDVAHSALVRALELMANHKVMPDT